MHNLRLLSFASAICALAAAPCAMAQDGGSLDGADAHAGPMGRHIDIDTGGIMDFEAGSVPSPFQATAVDDTALQRIAGREDVNQVSYSEQVAGVTKNTIGDNSSTGTAQIAGNAFQNMAGLSILNVNTGNNVAINASMNVNVSFTTLP